MRNLTTMIMLVFSVVLTAQSSEWNEYKLKEHWKNNGADEKEGIYKLKGAPGYITAIIKSGNGYLQVYLQGMDESAESGWKVGDISAYLSQTASPNLFDVKWFWYDRRVDYDTYKFENGIFWPLSNRSPYIKIYPIGNDVNNNNIPKKASATGFGISSNGIIVTNFHVIEGAKTIKVRGVNSNFNKTYNANVLVSDKNNDLALIQIEDNSFTSLDIIPFVVKTSLAGVGENIFVLGYPLRATMGDEIKLTNGIVSAKTGFQGDITTYQISAPVQPGNSGGPLFDEQGNLIGIINAKNKLAENASYGVKSIYLTSLIEMLPSPPKLQTINLLQGKTLTQQVELAKKFVFIIETE